MLHRVVRPDREVALNIWAPPFGVSDFRGANAVEIDTIFPQRQQMF